MARWLRARSSDSKFAIVLPDTLPNRYTLELDYAGGDPGSGLFPDVQFSDSSHAHELHFAPPLAAATSAGMENVAMTKLTESDSAVRRALLMKDLYSEADRVERYARGEAAAPSRRAGEDGMARDGNLSPTAARHARRAAPTTERKSHMWFKSSCSALLPASLLALSLSACRKSHASDAVPAADSSSAIVGANNVDIEATEFAFEAPDTIHAGLTTFRLVDAGKQLHHAQLVRLKNGRSYADLERALTKGGPPPAWIEFAGGPNAPRPGGGVAVETEELEPGNYAIICVIPGPDHEPHVMKGMMHPLTVLPAAGEAAPEPKADVSVHMAEYSYKLSRPITAGEHRLRVDNDGSQPHELELVRLADGKSVVDLEKWVDSQQGPPPGEPLGGVATMAPGEQAYFSADFTPGRYALICFVPDARDGKPHFIHGMAQELTVS
jgi:uncharacterized cupredoxin-like copper-binding protein